MLFKTMLCVCNENSPCELFMVRKEASTRLGLEEMGFNEGNNRFKIKKAK